MQAAVVGFLIRPNLSRRTFTITTQQMHRLKQRIVSDLSPPPAAAPSSFVAVVALAWASFVRAKHPAGIFSADDMDRLGWDWMDTVTRRADMDRLVNVAGSTRFPEYEATDFGWGSPARTELVTMNHDGQVVLVAGKGGVLQASVSLHPAHMDEYKSYFLSYLG
ncbi:hypothetical protein EJB05_09430, partial [Eragrostis curvula]